MMLRLRAAVWGGLLAAGWLFCESGGNSVAQNPADANSIKLENLPALQIAVQKGATVVALREVAEFEVPKWPYGEGLRFVQRRITTDSLELWTPTEGWLFDGKGNQKGHAKVPRRDGWGREWYGAFLPDGRWITTDLWEKDRQVHFFNADGTFDSSMPVVDFLRNLKPDAEGPLAQADPEENLGSQVNWARSTADGKAWVLAIALDDYGDAGYLRFDKNRKSRPLIGDQPWRATLARQLGPRGWAKNGHVPSDDGALWLRKEEPRHGPGRGNPWYQILPDAEFDISRYGTVDGKPAIVLSEGTNNIGFWPGGSEAYVAHDDKKTAFIDQQGSITGLIAAERFADAADGQGMLFEAADGRIVTLAPDHTVSAVRRFEWSAGQEAPVVDLYDDLKLGFFMREGKVVLAAWD